MCFEIYIGSRKPLPLVKWKENDPGFHVSPLNHFGELNMIQPILDSAYYYLVGSHTGCGCGLSHEKDIADTIRKDEELRLKDIQSFSRYLQMNRAGNDIRIFGSWWNKITEKYPSSPFDIDGMNRNDFVLAENIILHLEE
jgi:hypothetical protein